MEILENVRLADYTTLGVGGAARCFAAATSEQQVIEALRWARERSLAIFVLGGGSNLLVSDTGFDGLVLKIAIAGLECREERGARIFSAGAGLEWDSVVARAVAENCAGVECLSGIPGSVGGTPVQNVGAYGQDVSETIARVAAVDMETLRPVEFEASACGFEYRRSRFNTSERGRYAITRVEYALRPAGAPKLAYADLQRRFPDAAPTLAEVRKAVLAIRRSKGMVLDENDPESRSAGSFFKNPVVRQSVYERIAQCATGAVPYYPAGDGKVKLAAAWLIEQAGISKGFALGPAGISAKHTLALVNRGGTRAEDIILLMQFVQRRVRERFGVELDPEPVMLGFCDNNRP
jgi:UDP-N-acetylmuramate dehydrogenase